MTIRGILNLHGSRPGVEPRTLELDTRPDFMTDPRRGCNPGNAYLFFAEDHKGAPQLTARGISRTNQNRARAICRNECPFQVECAIWALENDERDGVWGGYVMSSVEDRRRARAETGLDAGPKPPTEAELRAERVAAAKAETAKVEAEIRELWEQGKPDTVIALRTGLAPGSIGHIRKRLGLATHYGPGGRRLDHELVR
jgi:hypothetical protein